VLLGNFMILGYKSSERSVKGDGPSIRLVRRLLALLSVQVIRNIPPKVAESPPRTGHSQVLALFG
jgi:hypothetical protein